MGLFPQPIFDVPWFPIQGFIGMNGGGKSALMVDTGIDQAQKHGRPILSNIWIDEDRAGVPVKRLTGLLDIMNADGDIVILDDIASIAPARETNASPPEMVMRLAALRHRDAMLLWSAPVLEDVDVKIRRVTQSVVSLKALVRVKREGQLWKDTKVSLAKAYDFRSETTTSINRDTPRNQYGFVWLNSLRLDAYDTREELELQADHAICAVCGKRKPRQMCKGHDEGETSQLLNDEHDDHQHEATPATVASMISAARANVS
ncbi:hypothetical protein [Demequina sp. NBRC 110054]|uniref:hypothetical protein n=1 Tax=Demequina sp. NBRC 110054 TaxID=1570343 RepID=UPI0009FE0093|nr:hypothetical protein [Demequina sp. NBRC 110054]